MNTDHMFPPPEISLSPGRQVRTGTNITIRCWNKDFGATFLLHKDGCSAPIQGQNPDGGGTATFTLFQVTPSDAGTYRCSYHIKGYFPLMSSLLGNSVSLEVTSTPAHPGAEVESHGNLVVAVVGGCAVALMFILVLIIFVLLAARRRRIRRGAPPRRPEAVQLQVSVCVSQPQIPICPLGLQAQLRNPNPCPRGAHKTSSPKWLTTTSCTPPNPAHGKHTICTMGAVWGPHLSP
ncbi:leukocyte immunoglobulin-like receptor subfamily B member 2 isoform X1 [Numida meleagris]|uniref:leukocyte immunoglobulin-like receptor subfamily B member 2 isoform X1 n=1 Tax=Numida meleagris TaxID=8996 RepID=UPI000B3DBB44|nr:leukocyte immunoglobulin-like receptor subfamily B member 2 isoform X1 [Numida meleagris]